MLAKKQTAYLLLDEIHDEDVLKGGVLVDIRGKDRFFNFHIATSFNISGDVLATKTYLRHKPLVLIGEGYETSKMERLQEQLKQAGFKEVKILHGGINAWRQAGLPLEGNDLSAESTTHITPQQFFPEREYAGWQALEFESSNAGLSIENIRSVLKAKQEGINIDHPRFLMITETGQDYEKIEQVVDELKLERVYYLSGGKKAYEGYLKNQQVIWNRSPEKWGGSRSCGRRLRWNEQKG